MTKILQTEGLKTKIDSYKRIIEDLTEQLNRIESERNQLTQTILTMQAYLDSYELQLRTKPVKKTMDMDLSELSMSKAIKKVLETSGGAMHAKDIRDALEIGGKKINSDNKLSVVYANLAKRKNLFKKVAPSIFALVE